MTGDARNPGPTAGEAGQPGSPPSGLPAAPLALYRRYRPASFAEVKGQDHVTEPLRQALRSGRVHHAYLFSGPRGCGKTSSARILARSLNCEQGPTPDPCGKCASCVALAPAGPGSIDVIEIDAASHGGVDDARDLRERAFYAPVSGRFKIYIIDEAHMVTGGGFNALLKLVEEPPPHLKFVFATTEPDKVIPTIRSRTHHYPFRLVPPAVLRELLEQILAAEGVPYEPAVLPVVIRAGAGSVRDALSVLDQLIAGSDESGLRYDRALALLGYTDDRLLDEVIEAFTAGDGAAVFQAIDHVVEAGHDARRFAADLLDRLRDLIVLSVVPDAATTGLIDAPADRVEQLTAQAAALGQVALTRAAEIISAGLVEMRGATSPRLLLELMCAQVLLPTGSDTASLAERLDRLEREHAAERSRPRPSSGQQPPAQSEAYRHHAQQQPRVQQETERHSAGAQPPAGAQASAARRPAAQPPAAQPPADTEALRARWPDVLDALQGKRRVAWMLLSNATVESLADGALSIAFAKPGDAKGFVTSGSDKDLRNVLSSLFGMTPQIRTTVLPGAAGTGSGGSDLNLDSETRAAHPQPSREARRPDPARPAEDPGPRGNQARRQSPSATQSRPASQSRPGSQSPPGSQSSAASQYPPLSRSAGPASPTLGSEPEPSDPPAPDGLTGTGLIERELGGRIIQELDGS